jgi:hypothetical protein
MRISSRHPELRALLAGLTDQAAVGVLADFLEERGDDRFLAVRLAPTPAAAMLVMRPKNLSRESLANFIRYMATVGEFRKSLDQHADSTDPRKAVLDRMYADMVSEFRYRLIFDPDSLPKSDYLDVRFIIVGPDAPAPSEAPQPPTRRSRKRKSA